MVLNSLEDEMTSHSMALYKALRFGDTIPLATEYVKDQMKWFCPMHFAPPPPPPTGTHTHTLPQKKLIIEIPLFLDQSAVGNKSTTAETIMACLLFWLLFIK